MTDSPKADSSQHWVNCGNCGKQLCKRIGNGRYETAMKKSSKVRFCAEIIIGTITCPRCGWRLNIPPSLCKGPNPVLEVKNA